MSSRFLSSQATPGLYSREPQKFRAFVLCASQFPHSKTSKPRDLFVLYSHQTQSWNNGRRDRAGPGERTPYAYTGSARLQACRESQNSIAKPPAGGISKPRMETARSTARRKHDGKQKKKKALSAPPGVDERRGCSIEPSDLLVIGLGPELHVRSMYGDSCRLAMIHDPVLSHKRSFSFSVLQLVIVDTPCHTGNSSVVIGISCFGKTISAIPCFSTTAGMRDWTWPCQCSWLSRASTVELTTHNQPCTPHQVVVYAMVAASWTALGPERRAACPKQFADARANKQAWGRRRDADFPRAPGV